MKYLLFLILLCAPFSVFAQHSHGTNEQPAKLINGFGDVDHPVTTTNVEAQKFFNQGLACLYGFNHEEAVRSFKRAAALDPQLAMAYWGVALALGSNYNLQADGPSLLEAYSNLQKAVSLSDKASESDRAYIQALARRYSADIQADQSKLAVDYKNAMGDLSRHYPDDLDAATLYAESMMNLRPWKLWTPDGKPAEGTEEIIAVLEGVLRRNPNHTGANHYYIHAVEASNNPDRALPSADRLGQLAPMSGHLVHMPSHIYIRTGDYSKAATSNAEAITADRDYMTTTGAKGVYTMMYYNHNVHFLASANAMEGQYEGAIKTARELEANVKPLVAGMPMLEMFVPYPIVVQVRFGKWDEILKTPQPEAGFKITTAYWRFARGMAYAGKKDVARAESELKELQNIAKQIPADTPFGNNVAGNIMSVAEWTLITKISFVKGDKKALADNVAKAVQADDAVQYNEPPDWDLPAREIVGALLLLTGDNAGAEKVFRGEIAKHPRNGRALFGLTESLKRQGNTNSARMVQKEFERAWSKADTKLSVESLAGVE